MLPNLAFLSALYIVLYKTSIYAPYIKEKAQFMRVGIMASGVLGWNHLGFYLCIFWA